MGRLFDLATNVDREANKLEKKERNIAALITLYLGPFVFGYTGLGPLTGPAKKAIMEAYGAAEAQFRWFALAFFLSWILVIPLVGYLADRFGRKKCLMAGALVLAVGLALMGSSKSLLAGSLYQFIIGGGAIIIQIVGVAAISDLTPQARASALAICGVIIGIGNVISPYLSGWAAAGPGWQPLFYASAILPVILFLALLPQKLPAAAEAQGIRIKDVKDLATSGIFLTVVFTMFLYGILEQGPWLWISSYVTTDLGATVSWGGKVVALFGAAMMLARLVLGLTRAVEKYSHPSVIIVSAIISMACLGVGVGPNELVTASIFLALLGAAMCMIWPSILAYATDASGKPSATVFGIVVGIGGGLGCLVGTWFMGLVPEMLPAGAMPYRISLAGVEIPTLLLLLIFVALHFRGAKKAATEGA